MRSSAMPSALPHTSPSFSDPVIREVAQGTPESIAQWIQSVAHERGVTLRTRPSDVFATAASRLADAAVDLDPVEHLLLALRRARVITPFQRGLLQTRYLR